jgi:hypothetical protein
MESILLLDQPVEQRVADLYPTAVVHVGDWRFRVTQITSRFEFNGTERTDGVGRYLTISWTGAQPRINQVPLLTRRGKNRDYITTDINGQYINGYCNYMHKQKFSWVFANMIRHNKRKLVEILYDNVVHDNLIPVIDLPQLARYTRSLNMRRGGDSLGDDQLDIIFRNKTSDLDFTKCPCCLGMLTNVIAESPFVTTFYDLSLGLDDETFQGYKPVKIGKWNGKIVKTCIWSESHVDTPDITNLTLEAARIALISGNIDNDWYFHLANAYGHFHVNVCDPKTLIPICIDDDIILRVPNFALQLMHMLLVSVNEYRGTHVKTKCIFDLPLPLSRSYRRMADIDPFCEYVFLMLCQMMGSGTLPESLLSGSTGYVTWQRICGYINLNLENMAGDFQLLRQALADGFLPVDTRWYDMINSAALNDPRLKRLHWVNIVILY